MTYAAVATVRLESGLMPFLRDIKRYPILKPEEEYALAKRWRGDGDREHGNDPAIVCRQKACLTA